MKIGQGTCDRDVVQLPAEELVVLKYLVIGAASPYAAEPLKDIYEADGYDEDADYYKALKSLAARLR